MLILARGGEHVYVNFGSGGGSMYMLILARGGGGACIC